MTASTGAFAALAHRDFRFLWTGSVLNMIGIWMSQFAIGWLVVELSVREGHPELAPLSIGVIGLARSVPGFVFGLFAGAVADRVDRRRIMVLCASINLVNVTFLAFMVVTGRVGIPWLVVTGVITATTQVFDSPARHALMSQLVPPTALVSAIGLNAAALNNSLLVGPLIGGALIGPLGTGGIISLWAVSSLCVALSIAQVRSVPRTAPVSSSLLRSIGEGVGYVRGEPVIRGTMTVLTGAALLGRAYIFLLPALAHNDLHVGAVETSWLLAGSGVGALAGSFVTASLGSSARRGLLLCLAAIGTGVAQVGVGVQHNFWVTLVLLALASFAFSLVIAMSQTISQMRSPNELRGRVMGLQGLFFICLVPLGTMIVGSLGSVAGTGIAISLSGGLLALMALALLILATPLRDLGRQAPRPAPAAAGD